MAWLPPEGMSGRLLLFEPWEGGRYRIELALEGAASLAGLVSTAWHSLS